MSTKSASESLEKNTQRGCVQPVKDLSKAGGKTVYESSGIEPSLLTAGMQETAHQKHIRLSHRNADLMKLQYSIAKRRRICKQYDECKSIYLNTPHIIMSEYSQRIKQTLREIGSSTAKARKFLRDAGIIDKKNNLNDAYQPE